jgi:hypothetical protein
MKKKTIQICLAIVLSVAMIMPISAQTLWANTSVVIISHGYVNGVSECCIDIYGYTGATISNVDIRLDKLTAFGLINIASWNDLSSGDHFELWEDVPNVEPYYSYRLSLTAEVWRNGTVDYLDLYKDVYYTENMVKSSSWITK